MIDTHCHIFKNYYENIDEIVKSMKDGYLIINGTNDEENKEVLELISKYDNVYGTLGIHPSELDKITLESFKIIEENINNPKIVGIGEIGLDYHYQDNDKEKQKEVFIKQIKLAKKYNKTIVVHSRDSINDTYQILKEYAKDLKIVLHCYSGSLEMAYNFIKLGCKLGVGGVLTFKNSDKLKKIITELDLTNFLLETDSPYLTPEPIRKEKNQPYNIIYVADKIAELKNITKEEVLNITLKNAIYQFDLQKHM